MMLPVLWGTYRCSEAEIEFPNQSPLQGTRAWLGSKFPLHLTRLETQILFHNAVHRPLEGDLEPLTSLTRNPKFSLTMAI